MSILHDILIQKIILIGLFAKVKTVKLMESPVSVPAQSMMFSSTQKFLTILRLQKPMKIMSDLHKILGG